MPAGRVVVYLHGGGYVIGSAVTHAILAGRIAVASEARVFLPDYRLAPEHPFPAAVDDGLAAVHRLFQAGADPRRLVLAGDSAGGGLALAVLLALRDAGDPLPAAAVLLSPWVDLALTAPSIEARADLDPIMYRDDLVSMAAAYLDQADPRDPLASPLYADLAGLPPLLVQVGTADLLFDDSVRLCERARAAGVPVDLAVFEDLVHVFQGNAPDAPESAEAVARIGAFVQQATPEVSPVSR